LHKTHRVAATLDSLSGVGNWEQKDGGLAVGQACCGGENRAVALVQSGAEKEDGGDAPGSGGRDCAVGVIDQRPGDGECGEEDLEEEV